jgi:hypothetical protein
MTGLTVLVFIVESERGHFTILSIHGNTYFCNTDGIYILNSRYDCTYLTQIARFFIYQNS